MVRTNLVIDTDPGIDDAVAITLAARLNALSMIAITTVHGNVEVERATRNARELVWRERLDVPVVTGAATPLVRPLRPARSRHGPEGLGYVRPEMPAVQETDRAADTIANVAHRMPGLTLCCLGPLTNLARAIEREPALSRWLGPVIIIGSALEVPGTETPWSEFNWWADPEAADVVLRAQLDVHLVPLDVTRRVAVPGAAIRALGDAAAYDADARFWADALRFYADVRWNRDAFDGCSINDAVAIALAADPSLASWRDARLAVSCSDDDHRGAAIETSDGALVRVAFDIRAEAVLALIGRYLFSRWLPEDALQPGAQEAARWLSERARIEGRGR
jgi:purine nucleosidase